MKRWLFLGLFIVLVSSLVIAETTSNFDEEKSYTWLKGKIGNWEINDVSVISFAMLAMINHGDDVSGGAAKLRSLESSTHCWPSSGCEVVNSALATLALYKAGEDVVAETAWLENQDGALNPALSADKWELEIISEGEGTCSLTYGSNQAKSVKIKDGKIDGDWSLNLGSLSGLNLNSKASANVNVDCSNLPSGAIIVLTYKPTATTFYRLVNEVISAINLTISNGCYGTTLTSGGCDYLTTAYATWALSEMDREIITKTYLESQLPPNNILDTAIVARITGKENYIALLEASQGSDGSWEAGNRYKTAWAAFALSKSPGEGYSRATNFLSGVVSAAGDWGNNIKDTAMALIAIHGKDLAGTSAPIIPIVLTCTSDYDCTSGKFCNLTTNSCEVISGLGVVEICDNGIDDDNNGATDCSDSYCVGDPLCAVSGCTLDSDCYSLGSNYICSGGECILSSAYTGVGCDEDDMCDSGEGCDCSDCVGESGCETAALTGGCTDDDGCADDEKCKDGACVAKGKFPWVILLIILVIIILGAGGFFLVKSGKLNIESLFKKKQPKRPSFMEYTKTRPIQPGYAPQQRPQTNIPKKTKEDLELEKSLREAEKLLYGK